MFKYEEAINDIASTIFLNFYKATEENLILQTEDTDDLILVMSDQYKKDLNEVEQDISKSIKVLVAKMPKYYLLSTSTTIH